MAETTDLKSFYDTRYVTPGDILDKLNPQRLKAKGFGTAGIGSDPAATGPFYIFVTRPDMNIETDAAKNLLAIGQPTAPEALSKLLTNGGGSGIIKLLTNMAEGLSVQDVVLDTSPVGEGWDGQKLALPKSTLNSRQDGTLQIEYQEWSGLPVTLLHKLWIDYIEAVTRGTLVPKYSGAVNYITKRILDYACSIYYFQTLPDARTIEFGARFTGCFPTAVPYSPWTAKIGNSDGVKVSVPYTYSFMEPMDPAIFIEFNKSVGSSGVTVKEDTLPDSKRKAYCIDFTEGKTLENFL